MKVALIQPDIIWEDPRANLVKATELVKRAASEGADVAVLPEMFTTGFSMNAYTVEGIVGNAEQFAALAKDNSISLIAGFASRLMGVGVGPRGANMALAIDSTGAHVAEYTKMHPFTFADEHEHYTPGDKTVTFELGGMASSMFICYDLRFPEVFREVAEKVSVIYVIASWPRARQEHWLGLLKARAIENLCYVVGVNRVGTDGNRIPYAGGSCVFGPFGQEVLMADDSEGVFMAELDPELVSKARNDYPFLKDIRK